MKNFTVLSISIALLAFVIFIFVGVYVGFKVQPDTAVDEVTLQNTDAASDQPSREPDMRSILVIHVDTLSDTVPAPKTIFLINFQAASRHVAIIVLDSIAFETHPLLNTLALSSKGTLNPDFEVALQTRSINYNQYILLDDFALDSYGTWMLDNARQPIQFSGKSKLSEDLINEDTISETLLTTCTDTSYLPIDVDWMEFFLRLIPKHLRTDYFMDTLVVDWKYLTNAPDPFTCEVLEP